MVWKAGLAAVVFALAVLTTPMMLNHTPRAGTMRSMVREYICVDAADQLVLSGSVIPVSEHLVLTAAHMNCGQGRALLAGNGIVNPLAIIKEDKEHDMLLLSTSLPLAGPFAEFRDPIIGEHINAFGFGLPEITGDRPVYTEGVVSFLTPGVLYTTCQIFPGMSGSAMYGDDGKVIGMVDFISGAPIGYVFLPISAAVSGDFLRAFLPDFSKNF